MSEATCCPHERRGCKWVAPEPWPTATAVQEHLRTCPYEALKEYLTSQETEMYDLRSQLAVLELALSRGSPENNVPNVTIAKHDQVVCSLASAGPLLFTGSVDGVLKIVDLSTPEPREVRQVSLGPIFSLHVAGSVLLSGHTGVIRAWSLTTWTIVSEFAGPRGAIKALLVVGNRLVAGGAGEFRVYDLPSMSQLATVQAHKGDVRDIVGIPDASGQLEKLYTAGDDGFIRAWHALSGFQRCEVAVRAHKGSVKAMIRACVPGVGDMIVSGSEDSYCRVWNLALAPVTRLPCLTGVTALAFSGPCDLLTGHEGGVIRVWSLANIGCIRCNKMLDAHKEHVRVLLVLQDGFASGSYDREVRLWYPAKTTNPPQPPPPTAARSSTDPSGTQS